MPEQSGDRRYDATPYRRQKAREEGRVPKSQDLSSAVVLVGALTILLMLGESVSGNIVGFMRYQLESDPWEQADSQYVLSEWSRVLILLAQTVLPLISLTLVIALASNVMQTGLLFLPKKLSMDLNKVSPMAGFKRLFALSNLMKLCFGLFKVGIVVGVAVFSISGERDSLRVLGGMDVAQLLGFICKMTLWTSMKIGIALLVLALFDYAFQRWKHDQDLRMTEQEMRDEMKTTQGDPQIAARRRAVQKQLVMDRMEKAIPEADGVVTNPTELAVAIRYDMETMPAPVVVAKGAGLVAQRIRRLALENSIPIVERKELAQVLYREVDVNQEVPQGQYAAVAEVLRYIYELKGKTLPSLDDVEAA